MVLPQPLVGEVMPSEVQPLRCMVRSILVRRMSKWLWAGSTSSKVTMWFRASSRGSGSKAASSAQAGPTWDARCGPRPGPTPPTPPGDGASTAPRCSLAFWIAA